MVQKLAALLQVLCYLDLVYFTPREERLGVRGSIIIMIVPLVLNLFYGARRKLSIENHCLDSFAHLFKGSH